MSDSGITASPLIAWIGKPLKRIYRDTVPGEEVIGIPLNLSCARNEYEGCLFGVRANFGIHNLILETSDLVKEESIISRKNIRLSFVGFIPVPKNTSDTPVDELERMAPFDAPDPILDIESIDVKAGQTQPCYFSVYVPRDAEPGDYQGHIKVSSKECSTVIPITLKVYPIMLPKRRSLYVTNWFSVDKIALAHNVNLWSEEFWKVLESWIALMSEYRQNVFWIPLDIIKIFLEDGILKFDFSLFDRYIELLLKYKADRIEIMHIASFKQWGGEEIVLRNFKVTYSKDDLRTENGIIILPNLLPALERHLEEKGLLDISVIHVADEPTEDGLANWKKLSKLIHKYAPKLKRIDAIETVGFEGYLEVWVPMLHHFNDWMDNYLKAMKRDYEFWFYTCCNPKGLYPNRFLDYPLLETRILHWINYAYGFKGYLHWGFNWWHENPFGEPYSNLPPGDTHIAYPGQEGPIPSLRLEVMRDGLEDYEYLKLLEEELVNVKKNLGAHALPLPFENRALEICKKIVPNITGHVRDPAGLMEARETIVKEIMDAKKRPLTLIFTEPPEWKTLIKGSTTIIVRGVCEEGSHVDVNGKQVKLHDGYFSTYTYPGKEGALEIKIVKGKFEKVIKRKFTVI